MNDAFSHRLTEAGWRGLFREVWDLRPAEAAALRQLMRRAGGVVSIRALAEGFEGHANCTGSADAIRKRIERVRAKLADVGLGQVIETLAGEGYGIDVQHVLLIENAIAYACGFEDGAVDG